MFELSSLHRDAVYNIDVPKTWISKTHNLTDNGYSKQRILIKIRRKLTQIVNHFPAFSSYAYFSISTFMFACSFEPAILIFEFS
jgi:hypothetical protein